MADTVVVVYSTEEVTEDLPHAPAPEEVDSEDVLRPARAPVSLALALVHALEVVALDVREKISIIANTAKRRKRMNKYRPLLLTLLVIALALVGCSGKSNSPQDKNVAVPKGDPDFPSLGQYWVIDRVGVVSDKTIDSGDIICQKMKEDGVAEVVVVIMVGIKNPEEWATHYGRKLGLGRKGTAAEGGNRGIVWLIRPDADERMTISVGRGLPKFTSSDYAKIMEGARDYIYFNNFDKGVMYIIRETDRRVRELYAQ